MNLTLVKSKIQNAVNHLYAENGDVIEHWKSKKSYVYAFAQILEKEFELWDIDCYFVHYNQSPMPFFDDNSMFCNEKGNSVTCDECLKQKWCKACPDIVVHRRSIEDRLLIVRTELSCNNRSKKEQHLSKIESFIETSKSHYEYGLFINWAPNRSQVKLTWLSPSIIQKQRLLEHTKIQETEKYFIESHRSFRIPKAKPETYIVGVLDILGAEKKLENVKSESDFVSLLNRNYHLLDFLKSAGVNNPFYNDNVIVRIYSDNILFAQKSMCKAAPMFDFYILRLYMAHYQLYLLSNGLLSRGFITQGKLFINDSFVIGSALVRVHKGEEEIAKYPRVVIDPELMKLLPDQIHRYPFPPDSLLKKDRTDGLHFLNYYQTIFIQEKNKIWHRLLFGITYTIKENLEKSDLKIFPKVYWLIKYHNCFCRKNHCDEFIIPQDLINKKKRELKSI